MIAFEQECFMTPLTLTQETFEHEAFIIILTLIQESISSIWHHLTLKGKNKTKQNKKACATFLHYPNRHHFQLHPALHNLESNYSIELQNIKSKLDYIVVTQVKF